MSNENLNTVDFDVWFSFHKRLIPGAQNRTESKCIRNETHFSEQNLIRIPLFLSRSKILYLAFTQQIHSLRI